MRPTYLALVKLSCTESQPESAWVQAPTLRKYFICMEFLIFLIPSSRYHKKAA
ncbi:hypothetical protein [Alysiella crassa]|uniref:hypothetical protein n=1 Tax=Alysiella crassa TaxID=153491 RepID=UPI003671A416